MPYAYGTHKVWLRDGKIYKHCYEQTNGQIEYGDENNSLHRDDGPAMEYGNGAKRWFIHGQEYETKEAFDAELKEGKWRV